MLCNCEDWREGIENLNDIIFHASNHRMPYTAKTFKYCPWCSTLLIDETPRTGEVLPPSSEMAHEC